MKIFSSSQVKNWDSFTIENEPVKSIDLMERAAAACSKWIISKFKLDVPVKIFCGTGNNGGDGLAIARQLSEEKYHVEVYIVETKKKGSPDFETNLQRLTRTSVKIFYLENELSFPAVSNHDVVIDSLFGTGLKKEPSELFESLINFLNKNNLKVISIDIPSGLYVDKSSVENSIIQAAFTLTFQTQKLAFLMPENESFIGEVEVLNIGLSKDFEEKESASFFLIEKKIIENIYRPRNQFSNKGNYGYACLLAGSYGMMGAAVLSARACLRSGVGKLTCNICEAGYTILQTAVPEAMCKVFGTKFIEDVKDIQDYDAIGIGPGIGKYDTHKHLLKHLFKNAEKPLVIDADALNVLSENKKLYASIPENSIITPHPKEFERLFGKTNNDFERMNLALSKSSELKIYIVLKGHHTLIATPEGKGYLNSTGNAGMATAGSGDVLTGIITGLLAQIYTPLEACIFGVYLHGLAGDIAAKKISQEAMIAGDIVRNIGKAFKEIRGFSHFDM